VLRLSCEITRPPKEDVVDNRNRLSDVEVNNINDEADNCLPLSESLIINNLINSKKIKYKLKEVEE